MYQRILVAIDSSHAAERALAEAIGNARASGGRLILVHALEEPADAIGANPYAAEYVRGLNEDTKQAAADLLDGARERAAAAGVQAEAVLLEPGAAPVAERIVQSARDRKADLIVMGTHGRHGVKRVMLGSNAHGVLRVADVPVLLVRTP